MADLVYTGRFDLNPARNTREKLLLPLADIKPLQQPGVYVAVMNPAGRYSYSNAATLFTLSDIGVSAHRYHNRLDVFTQSLEDGAAQSGIDVQLLNTKGQILAEAKSDARGTLPCKTMIKTRRCCWRERRADHPAGSQTSRTGFGRVLDCRRSGIQQAALYVWSARSLSSGRNGDPQRAAP